MKTTRMKTYMGLDTNDLANFKLSATLGFACGGGSTLAERLGAALANETDAASKALCRWVETAMTCEEPWVAHTYRSALVDQRLLAVANGVAR